MKHIAAIFCLTAVITAALNGGLRAGVISGRLTDPCGVPVQGAYTSFITHGLGAFRTATATTGQDGTFASATLPEGLYTQGVSEYSGFGLLYRKAVEVLPSGDPTFAELVCAPAAFCLDTEPFSSPAVVYAQSFRAQGSSVVSVALRCADPSSGRVCVAILDGEGPNAPQIGPSRTLPVSSSVPAYACWHSGEVPTLSGGIYTVRISLEGGGPLTLFGQTARSGSRIENPDGRTWIDGREVETPLAVIVNSDGRGVKSTMCCLQSSNAKLASKYWGQSFTASGSSLIAVSWPMVAGVSRCRVTLHDGIGAGAGGTQIGPEKYISPASDDKRTVVTFAPGEAPTVPGQKYYIKLAFALESPLTLYSAGTEDVYPGGQAFNNGIPQPWDLAMAIYEEESPGALDAPRVDISGLRVESVSSGTARVRWDTNLPADSTVQYGPTVPYPYSTYNPAENYAHSVELSGLQPNTLYHLRVRGSATGAEEGASGDLVFLTACDSANLLSNGGFEVGSPAPWTIYGDGVGLIDWGLHGGLPPRSGLAAFGGAGEQTCGGAYQRVRSTPGHEYLFSAWARTLTEDGDFHSIDRQTLCAIGIDPTGGTDPNAASVTWSIPVFSESAYCPLSVSAVAASDYITVIVRGGVREAIGHSAFVFDDAALTSHKQTPVDAVLAKAVREHPDGALARISDAVCIATTAQVGHYYIESADRCCGLRVDTSDTADIGDAVVVQGVMRTDTSGERYLAQASVLSREISTPIRSVCMRGRSVGGSGVPPYCAGAVSAAGPYNVGTLVKVAGRVSAAGSGWALLDEGSPGSDGIRISTGALTTQLVPGQMAVVTGIVQLEGSAGQISAKVTPRGEQDVYIIEDAR